jgi:hypothetical protein
MSGRNRTFDLVLGEVTALFTTGRALIPKTGRRFRKGSCSNERSRPRSDSIELDRSPEDTIREQAIAETPAAVACGPGSALPLSYRRMERRAGFEPATPRLSDEVTAIFTTDRERVGGAVDAVAAPKSNTELRHYCRRDSKPATSEPPKRTALYHEVTGIFTTAMPRHNVAPRQSEKHAGEQSKSALRQSKRRFGFEPHRSPRRTHPAGRISRYDRLKADFSPRVERSSRNLHHQRSLSRELRQTKLKNEFRRGALDFLILRWSLSENRFPLFRDMRQTSRRHSEPFLVRSAIGIRLAPRSLRQAPRFRARACSREPRDPGLPFRLPPGIANELCSRQQKTLRSVLAQEGPGERT